MLSEATKGQLSLLMVAQKLMPPERFAPMIERVIITAQYEAVVDTLKTLTDSIPQGEIKDELIPFINKVERLYYDHTTNLLGTRQPSSVPTGSQTDASEGELRTT